MYTFEALDTAPAGWDNSVESGISGGLHLYHYTFWADRLVELLGYRPVYFRLMADSRPLFLLQAFWLPNNDSKKGFVKEAKNLVRSFLNRPTRSLLWCGQPISCIDPSDEAYAFFASQIAGYCQENFLQIASGDWPLDRQTSLPPTWRSHNWATMLIDLSQNLESIYASFKPAARKEIRKAEDAGLSVSRIEDVAKLEEYYGFAEACALRYGKKLMGFSDIETCWRHLRGRGIFEIFVAYLDNEMMAGLGLWGDRHGVGEMGSFQSESCFQKKIAGPDLIKWKVLQWAHDQRVSYFDLAGVNPEPKDEKEKGIRRFKEKWGGRFQEYLVLGSA